MTPNSRHFIDFFLGWGGGGSKILSIFHHVIGTEYPLGSFSSSQVIPSCRRCSSATCVTAPYLVISNSYIFRRQSITLTQICYFDFKKTGTLINYLTRMCFVIVLCILCCFFYGPFDSLLSTLINKTFIYIISMGRVTQSV
jgi:hypothetical protein